MKRVIVMLVGLMTALGGFAQSGQDVMQFDATRWDFGTIRESDGRVSHTFTFTNRGTRPIVLEFVEVSCGCTTIDYSQKPVMAGQTGSLTVSYDPADRPGPFNKSITVQANNRSLQATLWVEGSVTARTKTVEELYPLVSASGIRISTRTAFFRYVGQGEVRSMTVGWANPTSKNVAVSVQTGSKAPYLKVVAPKTLCAGCRGEFTITYDLSAQKTAYGVLSDNIFLTLDGVRDATPIATIAYGVDHFSDQAASNPNAPRARFDRQYFDFGEVSKPVVTRFTLINSGGEPLIVRAVKPGAGLSADIAPGTKVEPSKSVAINVTLDPSKAPKGVYNESIVVIVNDPLRPMREVRLGAVVK